MDNNSSCCYDLEEYKQHAFTQGPTPQGGNNVDGVMRSTISSLRRVRQKCFEKTACDFCIAARKDRVITNYIGALQELCMARRWGFPEYTFHSLPISSSEIRHYVRCSMTAYTTVGPGTSRKRAKHHAARQMYDLVIGSPRDHVVVHRSRLNATNRLSLNENSGYEHSQLRFAVDNVTREQWFYDKLMSTTSPALGTATTDNASTPEAVGFLELVGEKEGFPLTYTTNAIRKNSESENTRYLSQVCFDPFVVYTGTGNTEVEATQAATRSALDHVKSVLARKID